MRLYTIGHSTRTADEFVALLQAHQVVQLADIRTVPRSRRVPQFNSDELASRLASEGMSYRHLRALGGLRKPQPASVNSAWQNASFRGYADYMATAAFEAGLQELLAYMRGGATAVMCAEAVWWSCHRRLLADALTVRGVEVLHIMSATRAETHELTPFARVDGMRVTYPGLLDSA